MGPIRVGTLRGTSVCEGHALHLTSTVQTQQLLRMVRASVRGHNISAVASINAACTIYPSGVEAPLHMSDVIVEVQELHGVVEEKDPVRKRTTNTHALNCVRTSRSRSLRCHVPAGRVLLWRCVRIVRSPAL